MQDFFLHFFVQFLHLVTYAKEYFTVKFVKKKICFWQNEAHIYELLHYTGVYICEFVDYCILYNLDIRS